MAEDVDAVSLDALRDDLQDPLADPRLNGGIREAVTSLERLAPPLHVVARVAAAEPLAGDDEAMDRPDDVMQRRAGACRQRHIDAAVALDADAQPQTGRIVEVALHHVLVAQLAAR